MQKRLLALLVLAATGFALAVLVSPHFAIAQSPGTTTTTTTGTAQTNTSPNAGQAGESGTFTVQDFKDTWGIIVLLVLLLALAWVIPLLIDLRMAYRHHRMRMAMFETLLTDTSKREPPLTPEELKTLLNSNFIPASPSGLTGLSRGLMAMMIATTIAVVLVALIAVGTNPDRLIKTIVTTLLAAFTTVVGFYFGARTAEGAQAAGLDAGVAAALAQPDGSGTNKGGTGSVPVLRPDPKPDKSTGSGSTDTQTDDTTGETQQKDTTSKPETAVKDAGDPEPAATATDDTKTHGAQTSDTPNDAATALATSQVVGADS